MNFSRKLPPMPTKNSRIPSAVEKPYYVQQQEISLMPIISKPLTRQSIQLIDIEDN